MSTLSSASLPRLPLRVGAGFLAGWVLLLSLAGVSPSLHAWLHAEPGCAHACAEHAGDGPPEAGEDGHYCGVIALQHAACALDTVVPPGRAAYQRLHFEAPVERPHASTSELRLQARAPPIEIPV